MHPRTFLTGMYRAGVAGHFDALAFHPYKTSGDPREDVDWNMMTRVGPDLYALMRANGDTGKKIWGTEFAYHTGTASKAHSEPEQARLLRLAVGVWREQDYAGPLVFFTYRDMGTNPAELPDNAGVVKRDFTPKEALYALRDYLNGH
jgi:polysaccharide biosynthesis protein PslG